MYVLNYDKNKYWVWCGTGCWRHLFIFDIELNENENITRIFQSRQLRHFVDAGTEIWEQNMAEANNLLIEMFTNLSLTLHKMLASPDRLSCRVVLSPSMDSFLPNFRKTSSGDCLYRLGRRKAFRSPRERRGEFDTHSRFRQLCVIFLLAIANSRKNSNRATIGTLCIERQLLTSLLRILLLLCCKYFVIKRMQTNDELNSVVY